MIFIINMNLSLFNFSLLVKAFSVSLNFFLNKLPKESGRSVDPKMLCSFCRFVKEKRKKGFILHKFFISTLCFHLNPPSHL